MIRYSHVFFPRQLNAISMRFPNFKELFVAYIFVPAFCLKPFQPENSQYIFLTQIWFGECN